MIARGCAALVVLVNFVFSVPVSPGHMDDKDVKVMKCIVEVIADALSKPHLIPVSQDCLETLSADDRLVSILRHHNFLREMQDIAAEDDQSMLVVLDKPEEDAEKRGAGDESSRESEETEQESQKRNQIAEEEELEEHESPSNHISNSINPEQNRESQEEATKREEDTQEEKKHSSLEKEKENDPAHHKDGETATDDHEANPDIKQSIMEDSEEHKGAETERTHSKEELEEEEEKKREVGVKRWSHVSKLSHKRVEASPKLDEHWEAPQHSKEREGQEGELWRSPEEQELQLMAQTQPQDKRDEEGSGSRKTGDAEIESLAAIESELESVAQKRHDLRRG
ncbi:chromogranin-A-like isoform X3 [Sinocyclocheilus anshuiensis]|uniref:chromogranin-A-like isoform X3 n=1 Tax=Sinocyclocheilus anshuiensis TaxID=1608454 RepID=UPI0007B88C0D|nr:PREDICTED: chromogranin-A-like isoform X3 [Sinocyclocheilus anshuiensis]